MTRVASETEPLLGWSKQEVQRRAAAVPRLLFIVTLISTTIAWTQVPILYVMRLMTCEDYYEHHPPYLGTGDRCSIPEIEASTASAITLLASSTTIFGVLNLLLAGWSIKKFGVRMALFQQAFIPILRLLCQILAVHLGGKAGVITFQVTQMVCIFGGPLGYMLVSNSFAAELVEPEERTGLFGKLQGFIMYGNAVGFLAGGITGDLFGIGIPFRIACALMTTSAILVATILPYIPPIAQDEDTDIKAKKGLLGFLSPGRVFLPQTYELSGGKTVRHYGVPILAAGIFLGVLATGFIPVLMQLYATSVFGFHATENGYLISSNSLVRGLFLSIAFPKIITVGRKWYSTLSANVERQAPPRMTAVEAEPQRDIPTHPEDFEAANMLQAEPEPTPLMQPVDTAHGSAFDLFFLQWSLVLDALLTGSAGFSRKGWHIYLAACLLPLGSGSAPAAKGVILEMCTPEQKPDALSAIALTESVASLTTQSIFGLLFSYLAGIGQPNLIFFCNAGVAAFAIVILTFVRFPPPNSKRVNGRTHEDTTPP